MGNKLFEARNCIDCPNSKCAIKFESTEFRTLLGGQLSEHLIIAVAVVVIIVVGVIIITIANFGIAEAQ